MSVDLTPPQVILCLLCVSRGFFFPPRREFCGREVLSSLPLVHGTKNPRLLGDKLMARWLEGTMLRLKWLSNSHLAPLCISLLHSNPGSLLHGQVVPKSPIFKVFLFIYFFTRKSPSEFSKWQHKAQCLSMEYMSSCWLSLWPVSWFPVLLLFAWMSPSLCCLWSWAIPAMF